MNRSLRTPLGRVRGLGSAKAGVGHFIAQRVTALALVGLAPWFLLGLMGAVSGGYDGARAWLSQPVNAILAIATIAAGTHHMRLGIQVVIEDYIHKPFGKTACLVLNTFVAVLLFVAAAYAILRIAA
jgi:succinate dehydrogenase / fumarate reductase membrane anchor subunit